MAQCAFCNNESVYYRPYSGVYYCKECFIDSVESKVQHTITRNKMLKADDRFALALSGGKDSISLLHILSRIEEKFPRTKIFAITIDEGIADYRSEAVKIAEEKCDKLGVELHIYSFKNLYNYNLDEIAESARKKGSQYICTYCGILRRKALNIAAKDLDASKLVTAHNLDDEVQSMLMNMLRGDLTQMAREENAVDERELIPRIKPLREVPEREVALYAFLQDVKFQSVTCPYMGTSLRSDVRNFLNTQESKHPGMKFTVYNSFKKIQFPKNLKDRELKKCQICGEPSARQTCMACQTLKDLGLI